MTDVPRTRFFASALSGRLDRRAVLAQGLRLGLATPVITALMARAPEASAGPAVHGRRLPMRQEGGSGTLTVINGIDVAELDPQYAYSSRASLIFLATYEMLIQYKGSTTDQYDPMLAQSWESNEEGSSYTFHLAPNAVFHDGSACDAQAVKDSYTRYIGMGAAVADVLKRFVTDPEQMVVVDPATIRFDLGRPQPLFLAAMASEYGPFVVNPRVIEANKTEDDPYAHEWLKFNMDGAGTGPYTLSENLPGERQVLTRFPDYHGGFTGSEFDEIVIRIVPENATRRLLMEQGEGDALTFDLTPDDVTAMQGNPDLQVVTYDTTRVGWIIMNVPRLKTKEVRQGFSYAYPYQEVIDGAYQGLVKRSGPLPDTVRGYDPNVFLYQTDLAKAKELILSGGFAEGDTFEYIFTAGDEPERTAAQLFQANLQQIGFNLEISEIEGGAQEELIYGDMPAEEQPHFVGSWAWWPDYNDPYNQFYPNFTEAAMDGGGSNAGDWVNPRFEEIMAEAATYTDEERLQELMVEAQNILTEQDPPCIYQGQTLMYTILRADIQGYYNNPLYLGSYPFYKMSRAAG